MDFSLFKTYTATQLNLLREIHRNPRVSRSELAGRLGVSSLTIINGVKRLLDDGVIIEDGTLPSERGRRISLLRANPNFCYFLCIDIGAYSTKLAVVRFDASVASCDRIIRSGHLIYDVYIAPDILRDEIDQTLNRYGREKFHSICFCTSGIVDYQNKVLRYSANITGWNNVDFKAEFGDYFGLPIYLDSSGHCFALAEHHFGPRQEVSSMIAVSVGYSVCTGIILENRLLRGASGGAGELGHVKVSSELAGLFEPAKDNFDGQYICTCGQDRCLELFTTLPMIRNWTAGKQSQLNDYQHSSSWLKKKYEAGNVHAVSTIRNAAVTLGSTLANVVNILNPQMIVLGGGTISAFPHMVEIVDTTIRENCLEILSNDLTVEMSQLGADSPIIGAALLAIQDLLQQ